MTVKKLKEELAKYPDHMEVFLGQRLTEFSYGLLNGVTSKEIAFKEDPDGDVLATDNVVILSED